MRFGAIQQKDGSILVKDFKYRMFNPVQISREEYEEAKKYIKVIDNINIMDEHSTYNLAFEDDNFYIRLNPKDKRVLDVENWYYSMSSAFIEFKGKFKITAKRIMQLDLLELEKIELPNVEFIHEVTYKVCHTECKDVMILPEHDIKVDNAHVKFNQVNNFDASILKSNIECKNLSVYINGVEHIPCLKIDAKAVRGLKLSAAGVNNDLVIDHFHINSAKAFRGMSERSISLIDCRYVILENVYYDNLFTEPINMYHDDVIDALVERHRLKNMWGNIYIDINGYQGNKLRGTQILEKDGRAYCKVTR